MIRSSLRSSALLVLTMCLAAFPGLTAVAHAAPVSLADHEIWVQLWPEGEPGTNVLIVGAQLSEETPLPATVQLPVPADATVYWAGEIMGSDASADVQREFKIVDTETGKAAEFTVETTRSVQIDATYGTIAIDGNDMRSELEWVQSVDAASTSFAVLMPRATDLVEMSPAAPGEPERNQAGETLYTLSPAVLKAGATYPIEVTYRRAGVEDVEPDAAPRVLWILGGLLAVAVLALAAAVVAQKRRA